MGYTSFTDIQAAFRVEEDVRNLCCLGVRRSKPCTSILVAQRISSARNLLVKEVRELQGADRRDIILLLLCELCLIKSTQRTRIKAQWEKEFPGLSFGQKGSKSPYSLHPSSKTTSAPPHVNRPRRPVANRTCSRSVVAKNYIGPETPPSPSEERLARRQTRLDGNAHCHNATERECSINQCASDASTEGDEDSPPSDHSDGTNQATEPNTGSEAQETSSQAAAETPAWLSETHSFRHGTGWKYSPWTLRTRVLDLLFQPIPSLNGCIYVVEVSGTQYVKIGKTTTTALERMRSIKKEHGLELNVESAKWSCNIPRLQLDRLEKLVHLRLAFCQVHVKELAKKPEHHEYFEIDLDTAMRTINQLWRAMQTVGVEPGQQTDKSTEDAVRKSLSGVDMPPAGIDSRDREWWKKVNSDHLRQSDIWDKAFMFTQGGWWFIHLKTALLWLIGMVMAVLFACLLPFPQFIADCVALFALNVWCSKVGIRKCWPLTLYTGSDIIL